MSTRSAGTPQSTAREQPLSQPVELPRRVRVGVDRERAAGLDRQPQQPLRRVEPLRPRVDLHGDAVLGAGGEDGVGVELRLGPLAGAGHHAAGAVAEDVDVRVRDGGEHPLGHLRRRHPQLAVHARDHDVQLGEQLGLLVEAAVVEDVDLDAGEHPEAGVDQRQVELRDVAELRAQPVGATARWRRSAGASGR